MGFGGIIRFSEVLKTVSNNPDLKNGVIVDTSILFAGSYPPDEFNTDAEELFDYLSDLEIPAFTNVNIRAEFIDQHRKVMIPEGLSDLYTSNGKALDLVLYKKLQTVYTGFVNARKLAKPFKFDENQIKSWRRFIKTNYHKDSDGWSKFCSDYLQGKIERVWAVTCDELNVNFLSLRGSDKEKWMLSELTWDDMASLVGKFGIGSFDAMIVNLFLNSHFSAIVTADRDIAYVVETLKPNGKFVIVPDKLDL